MAITDIDEYAHLTYADVEALGADETFGWSFPRGRCCGGSRRASPR